MKRDTFFRFASPSILLMTLLMVVPLFMAIWLGMNFMTFTNITAPQFVGLQNYIDILNDSRFWQSFRFTALYAAIVVPATIVVGFTVALLLDQVSSFTRGIYMSIFLLPFIIVPIVGTLMFKQLFEPSGLFTYLYQTILETRFRYTEITVKVLIILYGIWYVAPFAFVVYFAGLQTLSQDQIEAASIDGATRWQKVRHIVIPHLRSLTILILLFSIMDTYRVFDSVFVLSELNPIYKADTVMTYTFQTAITVQRLGKANAMAILTVVGIMVVLIPNLIQAYREQIEER
ncbi:carbohydrate ABC transporter permease [Candidatus Leptofilum sp.]|uniref:carbohydrate ABC transporter permease n=1 Tax=Candidatus Leptofilum sp. TaxID=3241576 RepID=UPI003B58B91C